MKSLFCREKRLGIFRDRWTPMFCKVAGGSHELSLYAAGSSKSQTNGSFSYKQSKRQKTDTCYVSVFMKIEWKFLIFAVRMSKMKECGKSFRVRLENDWTYECCSSKKIIVQGSKNLCSGSWGSRYLATAPSGASFWNVYLSLPHHGSLPNLQQACNELQHLFLGYQVPENASQARAFWEQHFRNRVSPWGTKFHIVRIFCYVGFLGGVPESPCPLVQLTY